jgi:cation diffusion facilitator CzcD-associated flavoprotein CzcO
MHSSGWDPKFDPRGKRIATIGNGASGIQVTTEIRKVAEHVDVSHWLVEYDQT